MKKLSICMIVKNEERVLARCLDCASKIADELIVVDTGSSDNSIEIAKKYTPNVYIHKWRDSFAEARNYSYSKATGDYIMWLDADDYINEENILKIIELKKIDDYDMIFTQYSNFANTLPYDYILRDRIIRKSSFKKWSFDIHEAIQIEDGWKILYRPDIEIMHRKEYVNEPERNINIFYKNLKERKQLSDFEKANLIKEYVLHDKIDKALALFKEIENKSINKTYSYPLSFLLMGLIHSQKWDECLKLIEKAKNRVSISAQLVYYKAYCLEMLNDEIQAEELYKQAISTKDNILDLNIHFKGYNDYYPYLRLALLEAKRNNLNKAMEYIDIAKNNYPNDEEWRKYQLYILLGLNNIEKVNNKKEIKSSKDYDSIKQKIEELSEMLKKLSPEDLQALQLNIKN